ncbi:hypothetical protein RINTU1_25240 [Candidatus Regiella insecticola]|uniref:Uncharacterized protein n=1 Tax=Candidatus Regiella insecticola TaxID=138073 RepID=A0A6L2ZPS9_9ENTR|nr:hypothetical protein RINTU1_25240 [Candidatus Regiella insecticola]
MAFGRPGRLAATSKASDIDHEGEPLRQHRRNLKGEGYRAYFNIFNV